MHFTQSQLEEIRYGQAFSELEADERMAQSEEAAGRSKDAAAWRMHFAQQSGLTPEEVEIVKKVADKYEQDRHALAAKYRDAVLAARRANPGVRITRANSPEVATAAEDRENLFPALKAELIRSLGSRSFSRLDAYTLHRLDNARTIHPVK
jgi:hypothetical protein